jgi:hypothetical protein
MIRKINSLRKTLLLSRPRRPSALPYPASMHNPGAGCGAGGEGALHYAIDGGRGRNVFLNNWRRDCLQIPS